MNAVRGRKKGKGEEGNSGRIGGKKLVKSVGSLTYFIVLSYFNFILI